MTSIKRNQPLYYQIYEVLWNRILEGEIAPGERMRDLEWADRLEVSRTPVREAIRKLAQDGILFPRNHGGHELRKVDLDDLVDLYKCRAAMEALAIREFIETASARDFDGLSEVVDATGKALENDEYEKLFPLNTQFHDFIFNRLDNAYLIRILNGLRRMILYARSSLGQKSLQDAEFRAQYIDHLQKVQQDHRNILDKVAKREKDAAADLMYRHIVSTAEDMRALLEQVPDYIKAS